MAFIPEDYEPVEDRIRAFWADHANGQIHTDLVEYSEKRFIVKATVYRGRDESGRVNVLAMGLAEEIVGAGNVNRTHALENCETSAIGRALANAGYAARGKRPSREEMQKAQRVSPPVNVAAEEARAELRKVVHELNLNGRAIADEYRNKYHEDLADSDAANQIRAFTEFVRRREECDADPEAAQG